LRREGNAPQHAEDRPVTELPQPLSAERNQDLKGRDRELWARRVLMSALTAVSVVALLNVVGQRPKVTDVAGRRARLVVDAPARIRGGLFYQGRIEVTARNRIAHPRLVLGQGWSEQQQINTIEPAPMEEKSVNGRVELHYDSIDPGDRLVVWLQLEANPVGAGRRDQSVTLLDGHELLAHSDRRIVQFP
jgi:hypothetical protein